MNSEQLKGKWLQLKGEVQSQWSKLTGDAVDQVEGDATKLSGKIQERYGVAKEEADRQID